MATGGTWEQLTREQIARLAAAIFANKMTSIAEGYMDISPEIVKNMWWDASNSEAFKRDILRHWAYRHPKDQIEVGYL